MQTSVGYPAAAVPTFPVFVAVADLNGDGRADIAEIGSDGTTVNILRAQGDGTLSAPVGYTSGSPEPSGSVAIADVNGDAKPDLAVANQGSATVSVLIGNEDGTFQPAIAYPTPFIPGVISVGDLNGDGRPDLAFAGSPEGPFPGNVGAVVIFFGQGDGTLRQPVALPAGPNPSDLLMADVDGDGNRDLVYLTENLSGGTDFASIQGSAQVMLGKGDGTFQTPTAYSIGLLPLGLQAADLDGDGCIDLAVVSAQTGSVNVVLGKGDGSFRDPVSFPLNSTAILPDALAIGDLNGDGRPDVAVAVTDSNQVSVLLGQCGK